MNGWSVGISRDDEDDNARQFSSSRNSATMNDVIMRWCGDGADWRKSRFTATTIERAGKQASVGRAELHPEVPFKGEAVC